MSQAILTKVLPATHSRPTRIKAQAARGWVTVSYDFAGPLDGEMTHRRAALELINRFLAEDAVKYGSDRSRNPWARPFLTGCLPSGNYAHVFVEGSK